MTYVEKFFDEKLNKKLETVLNKKYPKFQFKFKKSKTGGELIVCNKMGIVAAIFKLEDFDMKLDLKNINTLSSRYLDFAQDVSEDVLNKIYFQFLKRYFKLSYYDDFINILTKDNNETEESDDLTNLF